MNRCAVCQNSIDLLLCLCTQCSNKIEHLRRPKTILLKPGLCVTAYYSYQEPLRHLIWEAKIKRHPLIAKYLCQLFSAQMKPNDPKSAYDVIICPPSSLWSRLYGRWDLADFLASGLAKQSGLARHKAPRSTFWRWRKQSRKSVSERTLSTPKHQAKPLKGSRLLIVDDIVTSGQTLINLCSYFHENQEVKAYCLAYATK